MTDISKINIPSGTYDVKDAELRQDIEDDPNSRLCISADTTGTYDFTIGIFDYPVQDDDTVTLTSVNNAVQSENILTIG